MSIPIDLRMRCCVGTDALTSAGYPTRASTLATMAVRGGGPPFRKFGSAVVYKWSEGLSWARGRLSAPVTSTAELRHQRLVIQGAAANAGSAN